MKAEEIVMGISGSQFKAMTTHLPLSYIVPRIGKIIRGLILIDYPILPHGHGHSAYIGKHGYGKSTVRLLLNFKIDKQM